MKRGTKKKLEDLLMQQTNADLRRIASTINVMIRVRRMKLVVPDANTRITEKQLA